ncbi:MAG: CAAX prenyl protease-related protein [Armatimonadota bacterium]
MIRWIVPMGLFVLGNIVEGKLPAAAYPIAYCAKVLLVAVATCFCAGAWRAEIRFDRRAWLAGGCIGIAGIGIWLALEAIPYPHLGSRTAFDPFASIPDSAGRTLFLVARFFGLAVLVPVIEEVFWRGFALRFASDVFKPVEGGWARLALGEHSAASSIAVAIVFGLAHPEWLAGTVYALGLGVVLSRTRSLATCIVAHGVTNLLLGAWVLIRHEWSLW